MTLPELGESVTEGTVTRWLKAVGDEVAVDEPLLEISTDKVDTEIPSPVAGTLLAIKADEDETVEVGAELAIIGDAGSAPAADEESEKEPEAEPEPKAEESEPEPEPKAEEPEPEPEGAREGAGSQGAGARPGTVAARTGPNRIRLVHPGRR